MHTNFLSIHTIHLPHVIEHGLNPKRFLIISKAEKKRWANECFCNVLGKDIFYCSAIERKEDPRIYYEFLTDRDRLIGEDYVIGF